MPVRRPHFSLPFRFDRMRSGATYIAASEENSLDEIGDCVELIIRTEVGTRPTLPGFGVSPALTFMRNRDLSRSLVQQAIDDSEPRVAALVRAGEFNPNDPGVNRILVMYEVHIQEEEAE